MPSFLTVTASPSPLESEKPSTGSILSKASFLSDPAFRSSLFFAVFSDPLRAHTPVLVCTAGKFTLASSCPGKNAPWSSTRFRSELEEWTLPENGELISDLNPPRSRVAAVLESSQQRELVQRLLAGLSQPNPRKQPNPKKLHEKVWLMGRYKWKHTHVGTVLAVFATLSARLRVPLYCISPNSFFLE